MPSKPGNNTLTSTKTLKGNSGEGSFPPHCFFLQYSSFISFSSVITLEFRSVIRYGVLLYVSNRKEGDAFEYLAVELVEGKIVYHFNSGAGVVMMKTNEVYATGEWVKVCSFPFLFTFLLLIVSK